MMKNDFENQSTEKLETYLKMTKTLTGVLIAVLILLIAVNIYILIYRDNTVLVIGGMIIALSFIALIPAQFRVMRKIKAELKWREDNNQTVL